MDKAWIKLRDRFSTEYVEGVNMFIKTARNHLNEDGKIRCPCRNCMNKFFGVLDGVEKHLFQYGISPSYTRWIYHGEETDLSLYVRSGESSTSNNENNSRGEEAGINEDYIFDVLNDLRGPVVEVETMEETPNTLDDRERVFEELIGEARKVLYPGCTRMSSFNFLIKLMHIKVLNHWSNKSFDMLLQLLQEAFPEGVSLPKSYYQAKRQLRELGLGYESIHACNNDCILFWKEYEKCEQCPICGESRYKVNDGKGKKVPHKVLRHFPLIPRLQRLFLSKHTAADMRWHKEKRVESDDMLRHPADADGWKHFDKEYPQFSADSRNVRLALASDGFNPFGNMSTSYSMWPVILIPYNLPPWKCMKESFFFMSLLIPGPRSPGREIDVYLQPLIEELKELWNIGVRTYDTGLSSQCTDYTIF